MVSQVISILRCLKKVIWERRGTGSNFAKEKKNSSTSFRIASHFPFLVNLPLTFPLPFPLPLPLLAEEEASTALCAILSASL